MCMIVETKLKRKTVKAWVNNEHRMIKLQKDQAPHPSLSGLDHVAMIRDLCCWLFTRLNLNISSI